MFRLLGQGRNQENELSLNTSSRGEPREVEEANNRGWGGWGIKTLPQQQGFFSGPQTPGKGNNIAESKGFFGLGSPNLAFGAQTPSDQKNKMDKEEEYALKMKEKRKLNDLDWLAEFLDERKQAGKELNSDEQYGRLLMDLHLSGAKLDINELDELKRMAKKTRQDETLKEQERMKVKQRKRMDELSEEELLDIEAFDQKRENDEMQEYLDLLDMKEDGGLSDEERLKFLELLDRRRCGEPLEDEELKRLEVYDQQVAEEHLDRIEMKFLVSLKQQGEKIDDTRLRELELVHTKRQGVPLSEDEENDLKLFSEKRKRERRDVLELDELREKKRQGEKVDKELQIFLELLKRKLNGEKLSEKEIDDLEFFQAEREEEERLDVEELNDLLNRKESGENIDGVRVHELSIIDKKRRRETLTSADKEDLALFLRRREEVQAQACSTGSGTTARSLESNELRKRGLPPTIAVTEVSTFDRSFTSIGGLSGASYIEDLLAQKQKRDEQRNEQALEDALEAYHVALRDANEKENELLFTKIYQEILKENEEKYKEEDRIANERLDRESEAYKHRMEELEEDKAAFVVQNAALKSEDPHYAEAAIELTSQSTVCDEVLPLSVRRDLKPEGSVEHEPMADESSPGPVESIVRNAISSDLKTSDEEAERDELDDLLDRLDRGEDVDEDRLYELELLERHRLGESLTESEKDGLAHLLNQPGKPGINTSTKAKDDSVTGIAKEGQGDSLQSHANDHGDAPSDKVRYPIDSLIVRGDQIGPMTANADPDRCAREPGLDLRDSADTGSVGKSTSKQSRQQEQLDREELDDLLDRLERGEEIDEDRLYELELIERYQLGEALTADEIEDLDYLMSKQTGSESHVKGTESSTSSDDLSVSSAYFPGVQDETELLTTPTKEHRPSSPIEILIEPGSAYNREGSYLADEELADRNELDDLLDRLDRGEEIDEDRLYKLELMERYRLGEALTAEETDDLDYLMNKESGANGRDKRNDGSGISPTNADVTSKSESSLNYREAPDAVRKVMAAENPPLLLADTASGRTKIGGSVAIGASHKAGVITSITIKERHPSSLMPSAIDSQDSTVQSLQTSSVVATVRYKKRQLELKFREMKTSTETSSANNANNPLENRFSLQEEQPARDRGIATCFNEGTKIPFHAGKGLKADEETPEDHDSAADRVLQEKPHQKNSEIAGADGELQMTDGPTSESSSKAKGEEELGEFHDGIISLGSHTTEQQPKHRDSAISVLNVMESQETVTKAPLTIVESTALKRSADAENEIKESVYTHSEENVISAKPVHGSQFDKIVLYCPQIEHEDRKATDAVHTNKVGQENTDLVFATRYGSLGMAGKEADKGITGIDEVDVLPDRWQALSSETTQTEAEQVARGQLEKEKAVLVAVQEEGSRRLAAPRTIEPKEETQGSAANREVRELEFETNSKALQVENVRSASQGSESKLAGPPDEEAEDSSIEIKLGTRTEEKLATTHTSPDTNSMASSVDQYQSEGTGVDEDAESAEDDYEYLSTLNQRQVMGETLTSDESCEMKLLQRRLNGEELSLVDADKLMSLSDRRLSRIELASLREKLRQKEDFDELRLCELELLDILQCEYNLSVEEEYELDLYQRHQDGEELSGSELDELDYFVDKRVMYNALDVKLSTLRDQQQLGEEISQDLLFELELFERARKREPLDKMEKLAVDLLERNRMGENLTDDDMDDFLDIMEVLKNNRVASTIVTDVESKKKPMLLSEEELGYMKEMKQRVQDGKVLNEFEEFELSVFERRAQGEVVPKEELEELQLIRRRRQHGGELQELRSRRDRGEVHDSDRLYELELYERHRRGQPLDENELYELQLFEKRKCGEILQGEEVDDLDLMRNQRALDEEDLVSLREERMNGAAVDENLMYELELFHRNRTCDILSDDELMELEIFTRRRNGESLTESELEELELFKAIRAENALDEKELMDLRDKKTNGELVDENLLYELELFHRERHGDELSKDELFELSCFESRRAGEDLREEDLDELDRLKRLRLLSDVAYREQLEDENDSVYMHDLQEKEERGEDLADEELLELNLIQRKKSGQILQEAELNELAVLRRQRRGGEQTSNGLGGSRAKKKKHHTRGTKKRRSKKKPRSPTDSTLGKLQPEAVQTPSHPAKEVGLPGLVPMTQQAAPPLHQVLPPSLPSQTPRNQGLLGGLFGNRKKQKELELEMQRRQQEELIKQQLEAMNLKEELMELEEKQINQEDLVRNTVEMKHQESDGEDSSSFSGMDSEEGSEDDENLSASSNDDLLTGHVGDRAEMQHLLSAKDNRVSIEEPQSAAPVGTPEFSFTRKTPSRTSPLVKDALLNRSKSNDGEIGSLPRSPCVRSPASTSPARLRSSKSEDGKVSPRKLFHQQLALTLSAHLSANAIDEDDTNRFGDEISVGLMEETEKTSSESKFKSIAFSSDSEAHRPWRSAGKADASRFVQTKELGSVEEEEKMIDEGYIQEVFDKSVFSFDSQFDTGVFKEQNTQEKEAEEKDVASAPTSTASSQPLDEFNEEGSIGSSNGEGENSIPSMSETERSTRTAKMRDLRMMASMSNLKFTDLTGYDFDGLESKIDEKKKSDDTRFDETWENAKADKAAIAQFNQMRHAREREKLKKQEAGAERIPRLFLFEGERLRNKKKKVRPRRRKKLEGKLSREFRIAMENIFESDTEEEYDKNFHEEDEENAAAGVVMNRRLSQDSVMFDEFSDSSHSQASEASEEGGETPAGFDYLKELQKRSMQHDVRDRFPAEPTMRNGTVFGFELSQIAEHGYAQPLGDGNNSVSTYGSKRQPRSVANRSRRTRSTLQTGRSFDSMEIDPAEVYAQEVEKTKARKKFSVADFRKEVEDLSKKGNTTFEDVPIKSLIAPNDLKIQEKSMVLEQQKSRIFVKKGKKPQAGLLDAAIGGNIAQEPFDDQSQAAGSQAAFLTATRAHKQKSFDTLVKDKVPSDGKGFGKVFDSFAPSASAFSAGKSKTGVPPGSGSAVETNKYPEPLPVPKPQSDKERKKGWKKKGVNLKKLAGKAGKAIPAKKIKGLTFGRKNTHQSLGEGLLG